MNVQRSQRLDQLGSAIFSEVAVWKAEVQRSGVDVIDLGIGSPDLPPSEVIQEALRVAVSNPSHYGYPTSEGSLSFRSTVARWYAHKFNVELDAEQEIVTLMGSQDGLAHLAMAIANPGDVALVPDPGYPIYGAGLLLAGITPYFMPLTIDNNFVPNLDAIPVDVAQKAKFMILNYPSNPLSAVADLSFFERVIAFARKYDILIAHDLAYSEMAFDGFKPPSILQVTGAKEVAVEFHSLSKSFNMAGCRIAFMVGHSEAVQALRALKSNIDYGVFSAIQEAGIKALEMDMMPSACSVASVYEERRDQFIDRLSQYGWNLAKPKATMFIWAPIPSGWSSRQISREIVYSTGVIVIPGNAFGEQGEGYVRIALVQETQRLLEAADRLGKFINEHISIHHENN